MNKSLFITASLFLLCAIANNTQAQTQDQKTWLGASVSYELAPKIEATAELQHRSEGLLGTTSSYFGEFSLAFKKADVRFKTGLRMIQKNDNKGKVQGIEDHLRIFTDIGYSHRLQQFEFKHRLRLQTENEWGENANKRENLWRIKTGGVLKIKNWKLDPEISMEAFHHFANSLSTGLHKWRYRIETALDLGAGEINISYSIDREKATNGSTVNSHIIGLFYHFDL